MLAQFIYPFPPREHILWQFLDTSLSAISLFQDSGPRLLVPKRNGNLELGIRKPCLPRRERNKNWVEKFTPTGSSSFLQ